MLKIILIIHLLMFTSCMGDNGRKGRPSIADFATTIKTTSTFCTKYTEISHDVCYDECPEEYHLGEADEVLSEIEKYAKENSGGDQTKEDEIKVQLQEIANNAKGVCIPTPVIRPDKEVFIQSNYCACDKDKAFIVNNCEAFCADKYMETPTLFASVKVGPLISENESLVNLQGWCKSELPNATETNDISPDCMLELFDGLSVTSLPITLTGANSFTVDVSEMGQNKTYVAKLIAIPSNVTSTSFQLRALNSSTEVDNTPLKIVPISQYSCIQRYAEVTKDKKYNYLDIARINYYFPSNNNPPAMPPNSPTVVCHDVNKHGENDSPMYPRLELVPNVFSLWDKTDLRFFDAKGSSSSEGGTSSNGKEDVNDQIQDRLLNEYNTTSDVNIFQLFKYNYAPTSAVKSSSGGTGSTGATSGTNIIQGYYMQPWIDQDSKLGFCPTQTHFHSDIPIFRILKELVGVDTEAIYFAKRENLSITTSTGIVTANPNSIIIRESLLKKIWFYYENGQHLEPNDTIVGKKTIMFYYPPDEDFEDTYVKKSHQKIYILYHPTADTQDQTGTIRTDIIPPNKIFGCVPTLGD